MRFEAHVEAVVADPLRAVRDAAARGARAIGYFGGDIPVELILAAAATPVRLCGRPDAATPDADRYLEDSFSPQSRSIAQQWLGGELGALDCVIFSRSDDSAQRLYYYLCELQRRGLCGGPKPLLYDLATLSRPLSFAHSIASTRRLAAELGVQPAALSAAVQRVDRRAALLTRLTSLRGEARSLPGALAHRITRAAQYDWSEVLDDRLEDWLPQAPRATSSRRLLLIGSVPPDERLHEAAERGGGVIVGELNEGELPLATAQPAADPIQTAAHRVHAAIGAARGRLRSADAICQRMRELDSQGAIVWLIAEDTGLAWEVPRIAEALRAAGAPVLMLAQQRWSADDATLARIVQFARTPEAGA